MVSPYLAPEKIPEIHIILHDDADVESGGERRSLLYRPIHGEIKYRHAEPYKKVAIIVIAILLTSVVAIIGLLKSDCGKHLPDVARQFSSFTGLTKREKVSGAPEKSFSFRWPKGWNWNTTFSDLEKRETEELAPTFKTPKGWKPVHSSRKRTSNEDWKHPIGWKSIHEIEKRNKTIEWKKPKGWKVGKVVGADSEGCLRP
ncbi:hypothetical protein ABW19_dt0209834 [Dactylella cylindrospora]|nr:hypothetical protein ABW19_dt0209834 [Dactylella cylindrospora]